MSKHEPKMEYKVNIYLGDKLIKKEDLPKLQIKSKVVDRIINDAIRRTSHDGGERHDKIC